MKLRRKTDPPQRQVARSPIRADDPPDAEEPEHGADRHPEQAEGERQHVEPERLLHVRDAREPHRRGRARSARRPSAAAKRRARSSDMSGNRKDWCRPVTPDAAPGPVRPLLGRRLRAQQRPDQRRLAAHAGPVEMRCSWVRSVLTLTPRGRRRRRGRGRRRSAGQAGPAPATGRRSRRACSIRRATVVGVVERYQRLAVLEQHPAIERHRGRRPRRAAPPRPASARRSAVAGSAARGTPAHRLAQRGIAVAPPGAQAAGGDDQPGWPRIRSRASRFIQRIRASASTSISGQFACSTVPSIITMQPIFQVPSIRWKISARAARLRSVAGVAADLVVADPGHVADRRRR